MTELDFHDRRRRRTNRRPAPETDTPTIRRGRATARAEPRPGPTIDAGEPVPRDVAPERAERRGRSAVGRGRRAERRAGHRRPSPPPSPSRPPSPSPNPTTELASRPDRRTVGRFIADAMRAAGVRYAFTVPGESFLGLLDAFEGAGIRVVATRHEGAAAFMAEAHGQLTGRPAVCLGTRAVGGVQPRDRHPYRAPGLDPHVRRGRTGRTCATAVARRSRRSTRSTSLGRLAKWAAEPRTAADVVSCHE